ncbi:hypothetical protein [Enterobacter cloacae]|uniref:hypothetical protein n=1 Tax=Enterobacter cloacae TaxID=550 RepID=UPI00207518EC|nr:hypothetical protein [Enterobacter cloacae]MCM7496395.1 hypothetical protein [Enterobacter cloacae]
MTQKHDATMSLSANAAVHVTAKRSQSLIVILAITMAILFFIGCFLLYVQNPLFWVPFIPATLLLIASLFLAVLTHKNTDLAGAHATVIESGGPSGIRIVADPRIDVASKSIVPLITVLANIHMLPQASGLVDKNLNPIPNTAEEAIKKVTEINVDAQQACAEAMSKMTSLSASEAGAGPAITVSESEIKDIVSQEYTHLPKSQDV